MKVKGEITIQHMGDGSWYIKSDYVQGLFLWGKLEPICHDLPKVVKLLNKMNELGIDIDG